MTRKVNQIVSDVENLLREAVSPVSQINKGDFVHYKHPALGEWHVDYIVGDEVFISNPDGESKNVNADEVTFASKRVEDSDFADMPMENSLDHFDDEIAPMPLDQLNDMPAMDKGMLDLDLDAMTGDVDAEIDPSVYNHTIEKNPEQAGNYSNDETQDAGYPFPSFQSSLREFAGLSEYYCESCGKEASFKETNSNCTECEAFDWVDRKED
jgi:hypothetical protein